MPFTASRLFLLVLCICALAACARPTMTVDGLSGPLDNAGTSAAEKLMDKEPCIILPGQNDIRPGDLAFAEYKSRLAALFRGLGYRVTEEKALAGWAVLFSWETQELARYTETSGPSVGIGMGSGGYHDWGGGRFFGLGIGIPVTGGSASPLWRYTVILDAVALTPEGELADTSLWKLTLTHTSSEYNLRARIPAMLNAARSYIGKDTRGPVTVTLDN